MSFNELQSIEPTIVRKLSGVHLNAPDSTPPSERATVTENRAGWNT